MGGHTQLGTFDTLQEAVKFWRECCQRYVNELHLYLAYGEITYDDRDKVYRLAMRFPK